MIAGRRAWQLRSEIAPPPHIFAENYQAAISLIQDQLIGCVIMPIPIDSRDELKPIAALKKRYPELPLILYGNIADKELAVELGKIGIEKYVASGNMEALVTSVLGIIELRKFKVDFKQFGINVEQCPITIKRALTMLEKDFLNLTTVTEIANQLHVSINHFEREFTRCCKLSCKKLLIGLKLFYAIYLMENKRDLTLGQIAAESGFKETRSFYRSFSKYSGMTASRYRDNYMSKDFAEMFMKNVQRRKK